MKIVNFEEISINDFLKFLIQFLELRNFSFEFHFQFIRIVVYLCQYKTYNGMVYNVEFNVYSKDNSFFSFIKKVQLDLENEHLEININYINSHLLKLIFEFYFKNYKSWSNIEQTSFKYFGQKIIVNRSPNGVYEIVKSEGSVFLSDDTQQLVKHLVLSCKDFIMQLEVIYKSKKGDFIQNLYEILND